MGFDIRAGPRVVGGPARQLRNQAVRERLILAYGHLAVALARRFAGRGEPLDDLIQVGYLGLIKAVDRYDPARGTKLSTYAVPTVMGELRRYLRDHAWIIHVPRRLRELNRLVLGTVDRLTQRLGRVPSLSELAADLGVSCETAREACAAGQAYRPASLDAAMAPDPDARSSHPFAPSTGADDPTLERIENRLALQQALATLPEQLRQVVHLLYDQRLTPRQVARHLKISPVRVWRLRHQALADLHRALAG